MNCKPGEIAVQIRGEQENIGIFLRVLEPRFEGSPDSRVESGMTVQVQKPEKRVERTTP